MIAHLREEYKITNSKLPIVAYLTTAIPERPGVLWWALLIGDDEKYPANVIKRPSLSNWSFIMT